MEAFSTLDEVAKSSLAIRAAERFDLGSEAAFKNSLLSRFLDSFGRMTAGSVVTRYLSRVTANREAVSGSYSARLINRVVGHAGAPAGRLGDYLSGALPGWKRIWSGSRVSDYWRFISRLETGVPFLLLFIPVELYLFLFIPRETKYIVELTLFLMTVGLFLSALAGRRKLRWTELELPVAAFAGVAILSAVVNGVPWLITIFGVRALIQFYLLYFIVVQAGFDRLWLKKVLLGLIGFGAFLSLFGLVQMFFPSIAGMKLPTTSDIRQIDVEGRIVSTFANPNNLGGFLLFLLPFAIALVIEKVNLGIRVCAALSVPIMLAALIFSYSRGAWLGFAVALVVVAVMLDKRVLPGLAFAAVIVFLLVPNSVDRLVLGFSNAYVTESYSGGRLMYWSKALQLLATNPALGVGAGRFGGAVAANFGTPANAVIGLAPTFKVWVDSQVFQILAELGLLGLAAYLWVPLTFVKNAVAFLKREADPFWRAYVVGSIAAVIGILVQGIVVGVWETQQISSYFWLTMAIVMSLSLRTANVNVNVNSTEE